jgi:hypothetical protein
MFLHSLLSMEAHLCYILCHREYQSENGLPTPILQGKTNRKDVGNPTRMIKGCPLPLWSPGTVSQRNDIKGATQPDFGPSEKKHWTYAVKVAMSCVHPGLAFISESQRVIIRRSKRSHRSSSNDIKAFDS